MYQPADVAQRLYDADRDGSPIEPLNTTNPGLTVADAYAIQLEGRRLREASGASVVGRKIGLTSAAMQEMLGVHEPDFGYLTDKMIHDSGAVLDLSASIAPRVEAEIAFRVRGGFPERPTVEDVLAATVEIAPALEVVDSRIRDWEIEITDTVADNASSCAVVIGPFHPLAGRELAAIEMELCVRGAAGDEYVQGRGDAVLGHPARAVAWLVDALRRYGSEEVRSGELILPGALARAIPVSPGDQAAAAFDGLGEVTASFA